MDNAFPFYGELVLNPLPGVDPLLSAEHAVTPGHIWLSARLLTLLKLAAGDAVELGNMELRVAGELVSEPDEGFRQDYWRRAR